MNRSEIRYLLFKLNANAEGGTELTKLPTGFKESFDSQANFRGWLNFGVTWDVDENDPWKVILREKSIEAEWTELLLEKVPELPLTFDGAPFKD